MMWLLYQCENADVLLIGLNSVGMIDPTARLKLGAIGGDDPSRSFVLGRIGIISRSGGMTDIRNGLHGSTCRLWREFSH